MSVTPPRVSTNPYLDGLLAEVAALADRIADVPADVRRSAADRRLEAAVSATLALDGADPAALPAIADARDLVSGRKITGSAPDTTTQDTSHASDASPAQGGTWLHAFGWAEDPPDELVRAHEVLGAAAGLASNDLSVTGPGALDAIRELHRRVTAGLVAPDRGGADRQVPQAVHDASIGRILYLTCEPERLPDELARLDSWLAEEAPSLEPAVATAVLHGELLRLHPFDAANGRTARTASRLLLRGHGLDPDGLATFEQALMRDPLGYHTAVAESLRRRDWTRWVERCTEAVAEGLRDSARKLGVLDTTVPDTLRSVLDGPATFTLAEVLELVDGDRDAAAHHLADLLDAGRARRVLGTHGLRFELTRDDG